MKKYIGTKEIKAAPMTLGEFIERTGRNPYQNDGKMHGNNEEGYLVEYEDGYQSWSPKEAFDKAYRAAESGLDIILIEGEDLTVRMERIRNFIQNTPEEFAKLDETSRAMLLAQCRVMQEYQNILDQRYTKIESGVGGFTDLSFAIAIGLLENGFVVRRKGWNGKDIVVFKQVPAHIDHTIIPKMQSLPQSAKEIISDNVGYIDYTSQCLIFNTKTGRADSWVPSISDVFAEDWEIVE